MARSAMHLTAVFCTSIKRFALR